MSTAGILWVLIAILHSGAATGGKRKWLMEQERLEETPKSYVFVMPFILLLNTDGDQLIKSTQQGWLYVQEKQICDQVWGGDGRLKCRQSNTGLCSL